MRILDYLKLKKTNISKASKEIGVPYQTLKRWSNGQRMPRPENMKKIVEWSCGAVNPIDFYTEQK